MRKFLRVPLVAGWAALVLAGSVVPRPALAAPPLLEVTVTCELDFGPGATLTVTATGLPGEAQQAAFAFARSFGCVDGTTRVLSIRPVR